jgi:hypothetical protein
MFHNFVGFIMFHHIFSPFLLLESSVLRTPASAFRTRQLNCCLGLRSTCKAEAAGAVLEWANSKMALK